MSWISIGDIEHSECPKTSRLFHTRFVFTLLRVLEAAKLEKEVMKNSELLSRITTRQDVFGGKPIIRDMRIAVEHVLGMLAAGDTAQTILDEYPNLTAEDIQACLLFAYLSLTGEQVYERIPMPKAS